MTKFYLKSIFLLAGMLLFFACDSDDDFMVDNSKKDEPEKLDPVGYLAPLQIPDTIKLTYGSNFRGSLPEEYQSQNVHFELKFENENIAITTEKTLQDVLPQGIYIDSTANELIMDSQQLYPNKFSSSINGSRLPEAYIITLTANAETYLPVSKTFYIKIRTASLQIEELDNDLDIPFSYQMYSDAASTAFHISAEDLNLENTQWNLHQNGRPDQKVLLNENVITFAENPGDPEQKAEWTYDLISSLERDGFTLARRQFRVRFIPEIKFLYGMYYPDLDLTISTNRLHIGLHQNYQSAAPQIYPEKYKESFSILSIEKDGNNFDNSEGVISIDAETGKVSVAHNHSLTEGEYIIKIEAQTTTSFTFEAELILVMTEVNDDGHQH
ncbi:hypothetical protein [Zunongwangia endophytica]|uniref:DUF1735 domain-containing protein n=1 Tax=Zunongwangia endophytica TaxID=1808945 RepID=A0ABV8HEG9_9FLAO|nr:hypothetical protein [Zunongwangia endophytica]MDN3596900.1 hypothetical protein [Zunongwangia endophytica]